MPAQHQGHQQYPLTCPLPESQTQGGLGPATRSPGVWKAKGLGVGSQPCLMQLRPFNSYRPSHPGLQALDPPHTGLPDLGERENKTELPLKCKFQVYEAYFFSMCKHPFNGITGRLAKMIH